MTFYVEEEAELFPPGKLTEVLAEIRAEELTVTESAAELVDGEVSAAEGWFPVEETGLAVMEAVLAAEGCPYEAQVSLLLTDDNGIRHYNKEFRGIDGATDVLSFPGLTFERPADFSIAETGDFYFDPESGELLLGEVIISVERLRCQAEDYGHSLKREFAFLLTHSLLHLCGYDHMIPAEAADMEGRQEKILIGLGIVRGGESIDAVRSDVAYGDGVAKVEWER